MGVLADLISTISTKVQGIITSKTAIKTSIESKNVTVPSTAKLADYSGYIDDININGVDTSDATAAAGDILSGETAYVNGVKLTGSMTNQGAKTLVPSVGSSVTIPAGYHDGSGTTQVDPQEKSADATHSAQEITPDSGKVLSKVTVNALPANVVDTTDADALAANILSGKTAYVGGSKVTGSMPNKGSSDVQGSTASVVIPEGYYDGTGSVLPPISCGEVVYVDTDDITGIGTIKCYYNNPVAESHSLILGVRNLKYSYDNERSGTDLRLPSSGIAFWVEKSAIDSTYRIIRVFQHTTTNPVVISQNGDPVVTYGSDEEGNYVILENTAQSTTDRFYIILIP